MGFSHAAKIDARGGGGFGGGGEPNFRTGLLSISVS